MVANTVKRKNHRKIALILAAVIVAMFAFGYALVPLYNTLCEILGINGKTNNSAVSYEATVVDQSRSITVELISTAPSNLPWDFYPMTQKIKVHPGEMENFSFFAQNNSDRTMTVQAIPSVSPGLAAKYLKKTECFCFEQQTLKPKESAEMPVVFHLDELPEHINTITLSYTLFDVTDRKIKANRNAGQIS
ncbi:MAG: cytochrome c oxidase assembly protein [Gammaproteobacteria bacterium]